MGYNTQAIHAIPNNHLEGRFNLRFHWHARVPCLQSIIQIVWSANVYLQDEIIISK